MSKTAVESFSTSIKAIINNNNKNNRLQWWWFKLLEVLSVGVFGYIWQLLYIHRWLRDKLDTSSVSWYFDGYDLLPACEEPRALKHQTWFEAKPELYGCPPVLVDKQQDLVAAKGLYWFLNVYIFYHILMYDSWTVVFVIVNLFCTGLLFFCLGFASNC